MGSNRAFVLALVVTLAGCARARPAVTPDPRPDPVQQLRSDITALLTQPAHQRTSWGVVVESLDRNDRLYERNASTLLIPASALKLVTAAAAGAAVSWDYAFETTVEAIGPIEGGVLRGDLMIIGSGDPSIMGRAGGDFVGPLISSLQAGGIRRIDGRVIGDDHLVEEPRPGLAWSWDDLGTTSGAVAGALNIAENTMLVTVKPGPAPGTPTTVELPLEAGDFVIINRSTTTVPQLAQTLWAEQRPGESGLTIAGTLASGAMPARLTVAVGNPTLWFARFVRARIQASGIEVSGAAVDIDDLSTVPYNGTPVYTHRSATLADIVKPMLKDSINMYADALLKLATGPYGVRGTAEGAAAERAQLRAWGVPDGAIQVVDGSGLSRWNVVAPEALLTILRRQYDPSGVSPFMQGLPVAGVDGSLEGRMKGTPAEGNVRAKTGTMTNVRSLAGYVRTRDGEPLAFVIIGNNFESPAATVITTIDRVAARLASFSRN